MNDPALYERTNTITKPCARFVLERLVPRMRWCARELVLDVGCGPGDLTVGELLPKLPPDCCVVGGDLSPAMVEYAAVRHRTVDRVSFEQMDITNIADDGRTFSKVFSFFCLHWVQAKRRALENIHTLLVPDGETLLVFVAQCRVFETFERMAALPAWRKYMEDVEAFLSQYQYSADPCKQFSGLVSDVGFEVIHCSCTEQIVQYDSQSAVRDFLSSINPFLSRVPVEMHDAYMDDYVYQFYEPELKDKKKIPSEITTDDIEGGFVLTLNYLVTHAKKLT